MKGSKSKYIISAVIFIFLLVLSAGMYSTYPVIKEQAKNYEYNIFEKDEFLRDLRQSNYTIYFDMLKKQGSDTLKPSEVLIGEEKTDDEEEQGNVYYDKKDFNNYIYRYEETLDSSLKNLDYYVLNKDNNIVKERNKGEISSNLLGDDLAASNLEALNSKYSFYIVIDYNEKGDMTIKRIHGADKLIAAERLNNRYETPYNVELKPIKNMTYIYAIPRELQYKDFISSYKTQSRINSYNRASSNFVNPAIILIIIVALIIPYKLLKEIIGFKKFIKIPIEVTAFVSIFIIAVALYKVSYSVISGTLEGELINFAPIVLSAEAVSILGSLLNILFWTISFGIILISVAVLKHIWNVGVRQYLSESSLVYKFLRSIWRSNKRVFNYIRNIDLRKKENKKLAALLGINLAVMSIMCSIWFFGIFAAIIYTVILFRIITKHYNDISGKYNKLFEATNKIAEGNLEVDIEEDLGVFNALKLELENIQKGFKKAVEEEVKSQKMKTELITNVSHDLKTPLTSIITYVDLLKDEKLPIEKRREYLDTLDRKSQRLKDLIEDLFEVSKATSGNISLNIVDVDVVALMKQTLLELDDKISKSALLVKTYYPSEKVILPLDSQRMYRVFENLITNITKYAQEGSRVYIEVVDSIQKVQITFKNISANEIDFNVDEIMERFVRGDKARNTEGSGLGLAIAKSFIELQGGKLDILVDGDLFKVIITFEKNV